LNRRISITVIPPKMGGSVAMAGMAPQWYFLDARVITY
jgi:hypothetical protein